MGSYLAIHIAIFVFLLVLWLTKWLIKYLERVGFTVQDIHKENKPLIPVSGGLAVATGTIAGVLVFIFFRTFFQSSEAAILLNDGTLVTLFAALITILLVTLVGFIDDSIIKKDHTESSGLKQWQKPLLTLAAAVPLMVINAGTSTMAIPFVGRIDVGLIYPLLIVPIGVVGAANMVNLLEGFNGAGTGMGIVGIGMLGLFAFVKQNYVTSLIALMAFVSLLAFYYYNKYPAKILPGDSLTYFIGGVIAVIAIVGNMEKAALIVAIPYIIEFFLKLRGNFQKKSIGYYKNGKVHSLYDKIYSIPHMFTRSGKFTEKQVTYILIFIELVFSSLIWVL